MSPIGTGLALAPALLLVLPGCYTVQLSRLQQGLDSLRTVVDTLRAHDAQEQALLLETRRAIDEQRDMLMGTRASTGTVTRDIFDALSRIDAKVDDLGSRVEKSGSRSAAPPAVPGASAMSADALYDQGALDLTQGRYGLALASFRGFVEQFPRHELADNARYGAGECFFAMGGYDSAAVEYAHVERDFPQGDKVPAALYKLALSYERLGQTGKAQETLQALVKRFPHSGEAQLARERLGSGKKR
jgi:tol-pal system protein YbgF